jgi:hypothetical protein
MINYQFNREELEILQEVLERELKEIDVEVFRTDSHEFKAKLKHRRDIMKELLSRLSEVPVAS